MIDPADAEDAQQDRAGSLVIRTSLAGPTLRLPGRGGLGRVSFNALDPIRIYIVGGPATISNSVRVQLVAYSSSGLVQRLSGGNRYGTAADVAGALPAVSPGKVYHLNIANNAPAREDFTSVPLRSAVAFRPLGSPAGHSCVNVPDGQFDVAGTTGVVQSSQAGVEGPDTIRIMTTFAGVCMTQYDAEIDVRLASDGGSLEGGHFTLLIPGR